MSVLELSTWSTHLSLGESLISVKGFAAGLKGRSDDLNGPSTNDDLNWSSVDLKKVSVSLKGLLANLDLFWPKSLPPAKAI